MKTRTFHNWICQFLCSLMICLSAWSVTPSMDLVGYKPSWTVGQTWCVEVETLTEPPESGRQDEQKSVPKKITYGYEFDVEARNEIEREPCYQIRVEVVNVDGKKLEFSPEDYRYFYRFFCRVDDGSLKMLRCLRVLGEEVVVQFSHRYPRGPVLATESTGFLPSDFPVFSQEAQKYAPPDFAEPNATNGSRQIESRQKHELSKDTWIVNGTEKLAINITLLREHPDSHAGPEVSGQVWTKGMPWPLLTEYKHGDRPPLTAKLVRVDGSPIAVVSRGQ